MQWNDLSADAKGIIEWVEDPYTNKRRVIEIRIGECFEPVTQYGMKPTKIMVTKELYQEVLSFVAEDKEIQYEQVDDSLIFKIKDNSDLKLH